MTATESTTRTNVLILGKTGVGKSSLLNYLFGGNVAAVGDGRPTTTEGIHSHDPFIYNGISFAIYDSWGMEPGMAGLWKELIENELRKNNAKEIRDWFHTVIYCVDAERARVEPFEINEILHPLVKGGNRILFALTKAGLNGAHTKATSEELRKAFPNCDQVAVESVAAQPLDPSLPPTAPKGREELLDKICHNLWDNIVNKSIYTFTHNTRNAIAKKLTAETLNYFDKKAGPLGVFTNYGEEFKQDIVNYVKNSVVSIVKITVEDFESNIEVGRSITSSTCYALDVASNFHVKINESSLVIDSFSNWDNSTENYIATIFASILFPIGVSLRKNIMHDKIKKSCINIVDSLDASIESYADGLHEALCGKKRVRDEYNIGNLAKCRDMYGIYRELEKEKINNRVIIAENTSNRKLIELLNRIEKKEPLNGFLVELYTRHKGKTVENLVLDLRKDASNTIGRVLTEPVNYDECVKRAAVKSGVSKDDLTDDEEKNEILILHSCLKKYFEKLDPAEREAKKQEIFAEFGEENKDMLGALLLGTGTAFLNAMQVVGPIVMRQVVVRSVMIFAGGQMAINSVRFAALAVPFLNIAMTAWLVADIAGPAYRKIIPSVLNIALLRLEDKSSLEHVTPEIVA